MKKSKFTEKLKKQMLTLYGIGLKDRGVSEAVEIHINTLYLWIKQGKITREEIQVAQFQFVIKSKVKAIQTILKKMESARDEVALKAAAWWLERKFAEEFGVKIEQRYKIEIIQKISVQILEVIKHEIPDPAIRQRIADGLRKIYNI